MPRQLLNGFIGVATVLAFFILLRLVWSPDPAQGLFSKAQKLETAGENARALALYDLISGTHPESFYAPRSLLRQGDILAAEGRQDNDQTAFKKALEAYTRLANHYPSDPLSTEALLDAGRIAAENLNDRAAARKLYNQLLDKAGGKSDAGATATLKLGRLALDEGKGKEAQTLLQQVLRNWPTLKDRAAEAQFYLGVTYETLFKNQDWATNAYDATIHNYPASTWANDAKGRLGLIVFSVTKGQRPARRVIIDVNPLPDDGAANGSLWDSLRPVLAARGIEVDSSTLRGWSLLPFYAGFNPRNPSSVVKAEFDPFENVIANAGLRFTVKSGGKEAEALRDLQDEVDAARAPLVYYEEQGQGHWAMCVGYDSDRGEVMLQQRGARFDTLTTKAFSTNWKAKSSLGESYTLITFQPTGAKAKPSPSLTPAPTPTPEPGKTPMPRLLTAPTFVWELPRLSAREADNRTLNRAATLLTRARSGDVLLGADGLDDLARELSQAARASEAPIPEATEVPTTTPEATPDEEATPTESPYAPEETPTPAAAAPAPRNDGARARALLGFFGTPARQWAQSRRDAANWCDAAANRLNKASLKRAATALRQSASALEEAILLAPNAVGDSLGAGDRAQLGEVAKQVERARDAERQAAQLMQ